MRKTWPETWMNVAKVISERSLCSRAKIGSVVVDKNNRIVATGYNGNPSGFDRGEKSGEGPKECVHWCPRAKENNSTRDYSNCPSVHSEVNCLLFADRERFEGGSLYVTSSICIDCSKIVANSGIKYVYLPSDVDMPEHRKPQDSIDFLKKCGIVIRYV